MLRVEGIRLFGSTSGLKVEIGGSERVSRSGSNQVRHPVVDWWEDHRRTRRDPAVLRMRPHSVLAVLAERDLDARTRYGGNRAECREIISTTLREHNLSSGSSEQSGMIKVVERSCSVPRQRKKKRWYSLGTLRE